MMKRFKLSVHNICMPISNKVIIVCVGGQGPRQGDLPKKRTAVLSHGYINVVNLKLASSFSNRRLIRRGSLV